MSAPFTAFSPFTIALRLYDAGVKEIPGAKTNWLIAAMNWLAGAGANEDDPWCGSFMHFTHWILGYVTPKNPASARAWLSVGKPKSNRDVDPGDVAILWRVSRDGWQGHVGYFHSWNDDGTFNMLGGNQLDGITLARQPIERLLGFREPTSNYSLAAILAKLPKGTASTKET